MKSNPEERILVLAPIGRDSALLCAIFQKEGLESQSCSTWQELFSELAQGVGAIFLAEESLSPDSMRAFAAVLAEQPEWSDIPLCILARPWDTNRPRQKRFLFESLHRANVTIIERPARSETLAMAGLSALRSRRRQYQIRDFLTEKVRNEENLRRTQKLESIGVLAGGVAHDFNNLLTGILGNASLMQIDIGLDHDHYDYLEQIIRSSERAADLTRQLLAYSGKGKFLIQTIPLSKLVRETTQLIRLSIPKTVTVEFDLKENMPPVQGDMGQLQQVVMNLVINAAEAIPESRNGVVSVSTSTEVVGAGAWQGLLSNEPLKAGAYAVLTVKDNGTGMDAETLSKIFDPFFTTKFLGRGLGLSAVLGIVRGHHGDLFVNSVPGEGTQFRLLLPLTEISSPPISAEQNTLRSGLGTILVVDDDNAVRNLAKSVLERSGYRVILTTNGQEGVEQFRKQKEVALVLLDLTMAVMSGEEAFHEIRAANSTAKVLLMSGYSEVYATRSLKGERLDGFLQKPFTALKLAEQVGQILQGGRPLRVSS